LADDKNIYFSTTTDEISLLFQTGMPAMICQRHGGGLDMTENIETAGQRRKD
jgi:hypothetical protein